MGFNWASPYSQRDPQWASHALGSGAGEMGPYGCYETCFTMVAYDAYDDMHYNPASFDDVLYAAGDFVGGDNLPDNALDRVWPDRFSTTVENGFDQAKVNAAVASPDTYAIVCIHNPAVGVTGYHFMVMIGPNLVADPWWGRDMTLSTWGGPGVVVKTIYIRSLAAQRAAAQAAAAAQAVAAAAAKAAADKAAADAAAAAQAAADAKAKADALAAAQAAAADAREAAAHAAADAAARAAANMHPASPLTNPPTPSWVPALQYVLVAVGQFLIKLLSRK